MEAQLDTYLVQVEHGEEVVEQRRREMAWRESLAEGMREEERLVRLQESGQIKLGTLKLPSDFWFPPMPEDPEGTVGKALDEDREDRV
jgi:hypothetical protein